MKMIEDELVTSTMIASLPIGHAKPCTSLKGDLTDGVLPGVPHYLDRMTRDKAWTHL
jgi:hypothetical protein